MAQVAKILRNDEPSGRFGIGFVAAHAPIACVRMAFLDTCSGEECSLPGGFHNGFVPDVVGELIGGQADA